MYVTLSVLPGTWPGDQEVAATGVFTIGGNHWVGWIGLMCMRWSTMERNPIVKGKNRTKGESEVGELCLLMGKVICDAHDG